MEATTIRTKAAYFTIRNNNIVDIVWDAKRLDLDDCSTGISDVYTHTKERPLYYVTDIKRVKGMTKDSRDYFKADEYQNNTCGVALLVGNGISRITANFFIGFQKMRFPIKAFTKKDVAMNWIMSLKAKNK